MTLFGAAFDTYTEAEAIAEGYIVDVAASIISYKTLYHLHCRIVPKPDEERLYLVGVVAKALKNVAFQDDGLIQYKTEVMLRIFDENVKKLIGGRAKAMIMTSARVAGWRYSEIIQEKLKERGSDYKVLYAFSDFVHPQSNAHISEHAVNALKEGEQIEDRFAGDYYWLMIDYESRQTTLEIKGPGGSESHSRFTDKSSNKTGGGMSLHGQAPPKELVRTFAGKARSYRLTPVR